MRAGRLIALLLHIERHHGRSTAPELAEALEVSVRTVYRDIAALQAGGVPLWTEPGPDGGVRLMDGWRFPLDGLSSQETAALLVGPGGASALGLESVLVAAQSKVVTALPPELRARAGRMHERFLLDAPGWFHRPDPVPCLPVVAEAVWNAHRLDLTYATTERTVTRRVDPLGLVLKAGVWYLVAAHRGSPRTYRASRITAAAGRPESAIRPAGFELSAYWEASAAEFDRAIRPMAVRLRLTPDAARMLPRVVPGPATIAALAAASAPDADGRRTVDLPMESKGVAVSQLACLPGVEVLSPPELRAALAAHAAAVAALNT